MSGSSSSSSGSGPSREKYQALDVTKDGRAIAARGSEIEFKTQGGEIMKTGYQARYKDSQAFTPRKIMLQDAGQSMLFLSPDHRGMIVKYDSEYGKNIGQTALKIADTLDYPIDHLSTPTKFSELLRSPVVQAVGVSGNSLFDMRWDSRTNEELKLTEDQRFVKPTRHFRFTSIATTGNGNVVAGSNDGHVRLFSKKGTDLFGESPVVSPWKRPKTDLSQLADKVTAVDTTRDGEWIVWTTDKYIAVVNTLFRGENGDTFSGFEKSMGKEKPQALICKLSEEDLNLMGITEEEVHLTPATFDQGTYLGDDNILEENIVTSTGPFLIRWKFRHIKIDYRKPRDQPGVRRAEIIKQKEDITNRKFLYDKDEVVTALENDLNFMKLENNEEEEGENEGEEKVNRVLKFNAMTGEDSEDDEDDEDYDPNE
eukprot:TRINITY_DN562_c0_g1_i2.p1 TRINITY_DN562_c0_g1~~TRINITY_DN562_c0_g1_i2.p1  ORF type:complete len:426 (-),score=93.25 TRINITY_DN562_c0_g1_i2:168-1445(-)